MVVYNTDEIPTHPGYFYVPNFPDYGISTNGNVIKVATGEPVRPTRVAGCPARNIRGGYYAFKLRRPDGCRKSVKRHRLLCMVFKPIPSDPNRRIVNHIDGIPGNDQLDNLEWSTYSENTAHAYSLGLYSENVTPVEVLCPDGNVITYISISEASRSLGWKHTKVMGRLRSPGMVGRDGYAFREVDDASGWYCYLTTGKVSNYYLKSLTSGLVVRCVNAYMAADFLKVSVRRVRDIFNRKHRVINDYEVSKSPRGPWTTYSIEQRKMLVNYPSGRYPESIMATDTISGETITFDSADSATDLLKVGRNRILTVARNNGSIGRYRLSAKSVFD